jgi:hypothetical protein
MGNMQWCAQRFLLGAFASLAALAVRFFALAYFAPEYDGTGVER